MQGGHTRRDARVVGLALHPQEPAGFWQVLQTGTVLSAKPSSATSKVLAESEADTKDKDKEGKEDFGCKFNGNYRRHSPFYRELLKLSAKGT